MIEDDIMMHFLNIVYRNLITVNQLESVGYFHPIVQFAAVNCD